MLHVGAPGEQLAPHRINNNGWMIGQFTVAGKRHAFLSTSGDAYFDLDMPSQGSPDTAVAQCLNNWGQIAGTSYRSTDPFEKNGCLWERDENGSWIATDMNELLIDGDDIIEWVLAINDEGCMIARGRPDGTDLYGSRRYLLTPDSFNPPWPVAPPLTLQISSPGSTTVALAWNDAGPGWSYTVEACSDLATADWAPLAGTSWPISQTSSSHTFSELPGRLFLRVIARFGQFPRGLRGFRVRDVLDLLQDVPDERALAALWATCGVAPVKAIAGAFRRTEQTLPRCGPGGHVKEVPGTQGDGGPAVRDQMREQEQAFGQLREGGHVPVQVQCLVLQKVPLGLPDSAAPATSFVWLTVHHSTPLAGSFGKWSVNV